MQTKLVHYFIVASAFVLPHSIPSAFADDGDRCVNLPRMDFSKLPDAPAQVVAAEIVPATGLLPEHCSVTAAVAPHIGVDVNVPLAGWNGKLLQEGCGGSCGQSFIRQADDALARGYAVAATDQGHRGSLADSKWAYDDVVAELNAGYRATYLAQVVAEAIVTAVAGTPPRFNYFRGSSNGGRQALRSAQVFPGQFDGIIAGCAPPGNAATLNGLWGMTVNANEAGEPILTADILPMVHDAAIAACDLGDGVLDGVIGDLPSCRFDPNRLACSGGRSENCLDREQLDVLQQIYAGPRDGLGQSLVVAGPPVGSELNWRSFVPTPGDGLASQRRERRTDSLRYTSFIRDPGPAFQFEQFDWDRDPARMQAMAPIFAATNPDLRAFKAAGAKMLMYIGAQDYIPTVSVTDYYEAVERVIGGRAATQEAVRLFVIPGMNHCVGGPGAGLIDYLSYLERWVENDDPPDSILGVSPTDWSAAFGTGIPKETLRREALYRDPKSLEKITRFTRPHFPYPVRYYYDGTGDSTDASNYQPIEQEDFKPPLTEGVQGVGWYVVRAPSPLPLIEFYRDGLGLGDFRSGSELAMLWAGGVTVFEPNTGPNQEEFVHFDDAPFVPIFLSSDIQTTLARVEAFAGERLQDSVEEHDGVRYFRDPAGYFFGLTDSADQWNSVPPNPVIKAEVAKRSDIQGLVALRVHAPDPEAMAAWYRDTVRLTVIKGQGDAWDLDLGGGTTLQIRRGGRVRTPPKDRSEESLVPVYRVYGLESLRQRLASSPAEEIQVFEQTGGTIWYGADPAGAVVGFQERRMPSSDPEKWTTRLPEDLVARRIWRQRNR